MRNDYSEWDALGRRIEDIVDRAVNSHDFERLNQTIRQAVAMGSDALRGAMNGQGRVIDAQPVQSETQDLAPLYGSTGGRTAGNVFKIIGGGFLCGLSLMAGLFALFLQWAMVGGWGVPLVVALGSLVGGALLIGNGCIDLSRLKRFKSYRRILGDKTHCALEKLARATGKNVKFVRKELEKMIDAGLFLEGHIDYEGAFLITSHETYREFEHSRLLLRKRQSEQPKPQETGDARLRDILSRGNAFIAEIRRCNDAIPGEEISAKIDRTETIVRRIFQRAQEHPEIVDDLKKLMDYYLPMTVKLLSAYADMDAQPVQGTTIAASKREIEATLDTLNLAFEKLLDDLFKDTAMDVSSDISVLQTLLAQEGLVEDELTKMRNDTL